MAIIIGGKSNTQFSWIEYQVMMFCLAGAICISVFLIELALRRFQMLPLLFPGMFSIQKRRFYFYSFDVSDGVLGKKIRSEAKFVVCLTVCVAISYIWEQCFLYTSQSIGRDFPQKDCDAGHDCFAADVNIVTLFNRNSEPIDCSVAEGKPFDHTIVVTCLGIIPPSATTWLLNVAIAHSIAQLSFKAFELIVWIAGNSLWARRFLGIVVLVSLSVQCAFAFGGITSTYVSSWLSFVTGLTFPLYMWSAYRGARALEELWIEDSIRVHANIENHLSVAFKDIENTVVKEVDALMSPVELQDAAADNKFKPTGIVGHLRRKVSSLGFLRR